MKLIVQIPCFNEEKTLPMVINDIPHKIDGIDKIETLIIDDGSTDNTVRTARDLKVDHIMSFKNHRGLAEVFKRGMERSLELGADIIVNTDGDNQYQGKYIEKLVRPILDRKADMVIGCRDMSRIKDFSFVKKMLQRFGSYVVRKLSGTEIPDTTSGFRAYSKDAAFRLNVFSTYTYTLETLIQAGRNGMPMAYLTIETNRKQRESRLAKSTASYVKKSVITMLRIYALYEPLKTFSVVGASFICLSIVGIGRFLVFYYLNPRSGHIQSLVLSIGLFIVGFSIIMLGVIGDILAANRRLAEEMLYKMKKKELDR